VLLQKELELAKVKKELEALRIVAELLRDDGDWIRETARPTLTVTGQSLIKAEAVRVKVRRSKEMWKKLTDAVGAQPELSSEQTPDLKSLGAVLMESLIEQEKGNVAAGSQKVLAEDYHQPLSSAIMTTYTESVNQFVKNATAFIEQLPLLTKARDAYEQAMRASAGLREALDAGEENLRTLLTQLEQGVNAHGVKPAPDKKNPQLAKVEEIRGNDESSCRTMTKFP
jgi:hypothetical protein